MTMLASELANGKMQFNVKSAKVFREVLAKWHNADFEMAVALDIKSANVATYRAIIKTDNAQIEKCDKGEKTIKTREEYVAEIADYETRIKSEEDTVSELRDEQKSRIEKALALLSKDFYNKYVAYINEGKTEDYANAWAAFYTNNGCEPTKDGVDKGVALVGEEPNTVKGKIRDEKHNRAYTYQKWQKTVLGGLCDMDGLKEVLPMEKFKYQSMAERRKAWEDAKKNK